MQGRRIIGVEVAVADVTSIFADSFCFGGFIYTYICIYTLFIYIYIHIMVEIPMSRIETVLACPSRQSFNPRSSNKQKIFTQQLWKLSSTTVPSFGSRSKFNVLEPFAHVNICSTFMAHKVGLLLGCMMVWQLTCSPIPNLARCCVMPCQGSTITASRRGCGACCLESLQKPVHSCWCVWL